MNARSATSRDDWASPARPATATAYEAKTHLAQLLERAHRGETIVVTKHGQPFARIAPIDDVDERASRARTAMERIQARARSRAERSGPVTTAEILEWIHEDRPDFDAEGARIR